MYDIERAENVILALLQAAGGSFEGTTRLYKAFYFAHLYFARATGRLLTDWPIVRMPRGPGISDSAVLVERLRSSGKITTKPTKSGPFPSTIYELTVDQPIAIEHEAMDAVREAIAFVDGRTAAELSELSHEHSRSWNSVVDGAEIDVFLDILEEDEVARLHDQAAIIDRDVSRIFLDAR